MRIESRFIYLLQRTEWQRIYQPWHGLLEANHIISKSIKDVISYVIKITGENANWTNCQLRSGEKNSFFFPSEYCIFIESESHNKKLRQEYCRNYVKIRLLYLVVMNRTEIKACTKTVKNFHDPNIFSYNKKILATKNLYYL